jgi:hypothetical protein
MTAFIETASEPLLHADPHGLTCAQIAAVLQVDEGSVAMWERADGPHHSMAKAKVEAFITGNARPWGRRKTRGKSSGKRRLAGTP